LLEKVKELESQIQETENVIEAQKRLIPLKVQEMLQEEFQVKNKELENAHQIVKADMQENKRKISDLESSIGEYQHVIQEMKESFERVLCQYNILLRICLTKPILNTDVEQIGEISFQFAYVNPTS